MDKYIMICENCEEETTYLNFTVETAGHEYGRINLPTRNNDLDYEDNDSETSSEPTYSCPYCDWKFSDEEITDIDNDYDEDPQEDTTTQRASSNQSLEEIEGIECTHCSHMYQLDKEDIETICPRCNKTNIQKKT